MKADSLVLGGRGTTKRKNGGLDTSIDSRYVALGKSLDLLEP